MQQEASLINEEGNEAPNHSQRLPSVKPESSSEKNSIPKAEVAADKSSKRRVMKRIRNTSSLSHSESLRSHRNYQMSEIDMTNLGGFS